MKYALLTAAVLLALPAQAADMALKARPSSLTYPLAGAGCYWGVNMEASVAQSDVSGNALFVTSLVGGKLMAAGGSVGGTVGCLKGDPTTGWVAIQASFNYQNISGSVGVQTAAGGSLGTVGVDSKWSAEQSVKFGGFGALFAFLPNLGLNFPVLSVPVAPVPPTGYQYLAAKPYMLVGVKEFDNSGWFSLSSGSSVGVAPVLGMGMITPLADASGAPIGAVLDTYAKVAFPGRGFSINNVGGNPSLSGAANMGTQYTAGLAVYY
jgi:hypothetical protein